MDARVAYAWFMDAPSPVHAAADRHAVASILAVGLAEAGGNLRDVCARVGLSGGALGQLVAEMFPAAAEIFAGIDTRIGVDVAEEEQALRDLFRLYARDHSALTEWVGAMVARRAQSPNHLWQDLGLHSRSEASALMERHFPRLKARNSEDMKWKKFFYRMICRSEGFSLCAAPICTDCDDFETCFGAEDGESLLARVSNGFAGLSP
jgi:nitrogen fixation protein NifQ